MLQNTITKKNTFDFYECPDLPIVCINNKMSVSLLESSSRLLARLAKASTPALMGAEITTPDIYSPKIIKGKDSVHVLQ